MVVAVVVVVAPPTEAGTKAEGRAFVGGVTAHSGLSFKENTIRATFVPHGRMPQRSTSPICSVASPNRCWR